MSKNQVLYEWEVVLTFTEWKPFCIAVLKVIIATLILQGRLV